jgi:hypothetical protein
VKGDKQMALKRTELKRTKLAHKRKKTQVKKERQKEKRLEKLEKRLHYQAVCEQVDERDGGHCLECGTFYSIEHHHCKLRSQGGKDDIENIVTLCTWCHKYAPNAPHQSRAGRLKWQQWAREHYPEYWGEVRERA